MTGDFVGFGLLDTGAKGAAFPGVAFGICLSGLEAIPGIAAIPPPMPGMPAIEPLAADATGAVPATGPP